MSYHPSSLHNSVHSPAQFNAELTRLSISWDNLSPFREWEVRSRAGKSKSWQCSHDFRIVLFSMIHSTPSFRLPYFCTHVSHPISSFVSFRWPISVRNSKKISAFYISLSNFPCRPNFPNVTMHLKTPYHIFRHDLSSELLRVIHDTSYSLKLHFWAFIIHGAPQWLCTQLGIRSGNIATHMINHSYWCNIRNSINITLISHPTFTRWFLDFSKAYRS